MERMMNETLCPACAEYGPPDPPMVCESCNAESLALATTETPHVEKGNGLDDH